MVLYCKLIGDKNRFAETKEWSCLELPIVWIHKPIGEWMCINCALRLVEQRSKE